MSSNLSSNDALDYHQYPQPGKIEVIPTKPFVTQRDLSLAYTPGVAVPCLEIEKDKSKVYDYTSKGNLVAVISNGTAVLGLGDIGPEASKPVMEGKAGLFKVFADINVFDIELNSKDPEEIVRVCEVMAPTFGGINLEDIKSPECFYIEKELQRRLDIPVFHDDQHGTAIISGAALVNAVEIAGKKIDEVVMVVNGAGAAALACALFYLALGVKKENVYMCDTKGVIFKGRTELMNEFKEEFALETDKRTLSEALTGADVFVGLSVGNVLTQDMVRLMAKDPIVFAMANPDPEITYPEALAAREDIIMATGRSDYPNQVNNVLGFPFIFRGALDVHAKSINLEMKVAAAKAIAKLAKEEVPESVKRAYGVKELIFGRDYIIPKPFDQRVLTYVAPAVAKAAMETGVARKEILDFDEYRQQLDIRMGRARSFMPLIYKKAKGNPKRVVLAEGENSKIIKAAQVMVEEGIASPILIGNTNIIKAIAEDYRYNLKGIEIINPHTYQDTLFFAEELFKIRQRKGMTMVEAKEQILDNKNSFASIMVKNKIADVMLTGLTTNYSKALKPVIEVIGKDKNYNTVSGLYIVSTKSKTYFLSDTTVNIDPTPEFIADIAIQASKFAMNFDIEPRVALLSYSNFGSAKGASPDKMRKALEIIKQKAPELMVDGEMQADTAVSRDIIEEEFPFSNLSKSANVLIFPNLDASNIAYKLLNKLGNTNIIGPVLLGTASPVHILQYGSDLKEIIDMTAIAVVDAQDRE
ncbi:MAG: NADP-dependent malic enzyme [Candidatus Kapaibacteriota bacterium]|jgi:malate dehydrogenase (oxaloacetate-decarboxylating)(NADP+)